MTEIMQIGDLLDSTCKLYDVTIDEITSVEKTQKAVIPRIVFANVAKECGWTYVEIGIAVRRTPGMIANYIRSKRKNTVLYNRGYNSLKNTVARGSGKLYYIET